MGRRKPPPPLALPPDWAWIKRQYRIGMKSTREIARESTAKGRKVSHVRITQRIQAEGWTRDLKAEVRARVGAELAVDALNTLNRDGATDEEVIGAAATQGVEVIRAHRSDIAKSRRVESMLMDQLEDATRDVRELEGLIAVETAPAQDATTKDREDATARRQRLMRLIGLPQRVTIYKDLVQAQRHRIGLERQAYNLNDNDVTPDSIEERLARLDD